MPSPSVAPGDSDVRSSRVSFASFLSSFSFPVTSVSSFASNFSLLVASSSLSLSSHSFPGLVSNSFQGSVASSFAWPRWGRLFMLCLPPFLFQGIR